MVPISTKGSVAFIGAGPGDPELLTLKAVRYLQEADIILADRLANPSIIETHALPGVQVISVGKQAGRSASMPQEQTSRLMVQHAREGKRVVRLKGGDISIFSNILDELLALQQAGIAYQLVPGISAASGASAYSGIPLTARGFAAGVRYLTYHHEDILPDRYWKDLATTADTLVFYMSSGTSVSLVQQLLRFYQGDGRRIAVMEQVTTPAQRIRSYSLAEFVRAAPDMASPTLLVIGQVVKLYEQFAWWHEHATDELFFEPIQGRVLSAPLLDNVETA